MYNKGLLTRYMRKLIVLFTTLFGKQSALEILRILPPNLQPNHLRVSSDPISQNKPCQR